MKALVYGGLGLWLQSLSDPKTQLSEVQDHTVSLEERLDESLGGQRSDVRPFRLEGFAQQKREAGSVSTLGPHRLHVLPPGGATTTEEPL